MNPQVRVELVPQTIDDYKADQWLWKRWGTVVDGADPGSKVFRVHAARLAVCEPLIDLTVADLGPGVGRLVTVVALEEGDIDDDTLDPAATFPDEPLPDDAGDPVSAGGKCAL